MEFETVSSFVSQFDYGYCPELCSHLFWTDYETKRCFLGSVRNYAHICFGLITKPNVIFDGSGANPTDLKAPEEQVGLRRRPSLYYTPC